MDSKLFGEAIVKFTAGLILVGLLTFLPAGTFAYGQAWLLIGILFVPMFVAGLWRGSGIRPFVSTTDASGFDTEQTYRKRQSGVTAATRDI